MIIFKINQERNFGENANRREGTNITHNFYRWNKYMDVKCWSRNVIYHLSNLCLLPSWRFKWKNLSWSLRTIWVKLRLIKFLLVKRIWFSNEQLEDRSIQNLAQDFKIRHSQKQFPFLSTVVLKFALKYELLFKTILFSLLWLFFHFKDLI